MLTPMAITKYPATAAIHRNTRTSTPQTRLLLTFLFYTQLRYLSPTLTGAILRIVGWLSRHFLTRNDGIRLPVNPLFKSS